MWGYLQPLPLRQPLSEANHRHKLDVGLGVVDEVGGGGGGGVVALVGLPDPLDGSKDFKTAASSPPDFTAPKRACCSISA